MRLPRPLSATLLSACLILSGCADPESDSAAESPDDSQVIHVVATVGMVADVVREVGGDRVWVSQIMGDGVDPHLYKPNRDDVKLIRDADVVLYSGLLLEGRMTDSLEQMSHSKPVVAVTKDLDKSMLLTPEDFEGHEDPHVWMDVSAWAQCVNIVTETLAQTMPQHEEDLFESAEKYRSKLQSLHEYGLSSIASIPEDSRLLITSHDAFNYLGRAYGLTVRGVQGISTESEAGLKQVNELVDLLVERKVKAVFIESSVPRKSIDALIEGARAKGHEVKVGGELFSDAMGVHGTYEGTYVGMLDHNITTVTRALGGDAPETGLNGKLGADE